MKKIKPNLVLVNKKERLYFNVFTHRYLDATEARCWYRGRLPGTVRPSHLPGGSSHHPVKLGAKKRRAA